MNHSYTIANILFKATQGSFSVNRNRIGIENTIVFIHIINTVDISHRPNSMKGMKIHRSNISYDMNQQDLQKLAIQEQLKKNQEKERLQRLQQHDQQQHHHFPNCLRD